jgi:hypothetical protein
VTSTLGQGTHFVLRIARVTPQEGGHDPVLVQAAASAVGLSGSSA